MEMVVLSRGFVSLITNGILSLAINDTSYLLLGFVKDAVIEHPDIKNTLIKLDLNNKLTIIDNFIKNVPEKYQHNKCINISLDGIHNIIIEINNELTLINKIVEDHSKKYFYYIRKYDYYDNLKNLEKLNKILDDRFHLFLKLLKTINIIH